MVDNGQGNARKIPELTLKKGELTFDGETDTITIILKDISKPYSEPGTVIEVGSVFVLSEVKNSKTIVYLTLNYTNILNLTVSKADVLKKYDPASIPYSFIISNEGGGAGIPFVVNIQEISSSGSSEAGIVRPQCTMNANCNSGGACKTGSCTIGRCSYANKSNGAACSGGTCDGAGRCISSPPSSSCGNNLVDTGEQCDDKNTNSEDGCSSTCQVEVISISSCGQVIDKSGRIYVLQNDLSLGSAGSQTCLEISADNIVIDGKGHKVYKSENGGSGVGIKIDSHKNATLNNMTVKDFNIGIDMSNSNNLTITNSNISGNGGNNDAGIKVQNSFDITLINNIISKNNYGINTNVQGINITNNFICYNINHFNLVCSINTHDFIGSDNYFDQSIIRPTPYFNCGINLLTNLRTCSSSTI